MPTSVVMPALEMAQETGKLISWLKKEGETVAKGEPLLEVETDKAVMEVESPADGVLAGVKAEAGAEIQVGRTIAWIVKPGEAAPVEDAATEAKADLGRKFAVGPGTFTPTPAPGLSGATEGREIKISPKARRLAKEKGVDLAQVRGSGPGGEILASDIEEAAKDSTQAKNASESGTRDGTIPLKPTSGWSGAPAEEKTSTAERAGITPNAGVPGTPAPVPHQLSPVARLMAERTTGSWTSVPHFFLTREVDATGLNEARKTLGPGVDKSYGVKLTHGDLLVALVARVLAKHPRLNSSWAGDSVRVNPDINISVAMAVSEGVVAPVIPHADRTNLGGIALERRELADRARTNKLRPADLAGGTFTVSNLGMFEVDRFTAIITPPQSAILAVGRIADRVVAVDGKPVVRPMVNLTLSTDHRVADGARAAEFMRDLAAAIGKPEEWLG